MTAIFQKEKYKREEGTKKYYSSILDKIEERLQVLNKEPALSLLTSKKIKITNLQERKNEIIIEGREVLYKIEKSSIHESLKDPIKMQYAELFSEENIINF